MVVKRKCGQQMESEQNKKKSYSCKMARLIIY